jgi:uncharacterized protein (TIGR02996 family)
MTDRDALIRCILESPNDDLPRLIFADWLEEHGEAARAEFIRVQCELARTNPVIVELVGSMSSRKWEAPEYRRVDELRRRERELWDSTGSYRWFGDEWLGWVLGPGVNHRTRQSGNLTRGFISSISCSWSDFIRVRESLIWSPKQTVECPNNVEPGICARDGGCDLCGTTGRIPRPFTRSARCEACGGVFRPFKEK